ncbi:hypothetical protein [Phenylobacterium sp.]|uniref:hypothetical protein n=1 Tax=Phenylobacterium sp. TaxID=1871053 RepID=UPI002733C2E8|nr:hypothetical protein [Phenylobacterium sp.]MDP3852453.1 hypothetical protein [Phenylobacterium sp.]
MDRLEDAHLPVRIIALDKHPHSAGFPETAGYVRRGDEKVNLGIVGKHITDDGMNINHDVKRPSLGLGRKRALATVEIAVRGSLASGGGLEGMQPRGLDDGQNRAAGGRVELTILADTAG